MGTGSGGRGMLETVGQSSEAVVIGIDPARAGGEDECWIALRCAANQTMVLGTVLGASGTSGWTPVRIERRRVPRTTTRRPVRIPLLPTYVFLAERDLVVADALRRAFQCPPFTAMRVLGALATFGSDALAPLRLACSSSADAPEARLRFPAPGSRVILRFGVFGGLRGVVEGRTRHESMVRLNDRGIVLKIPPFLFDLIER